MTDLPTSLSYYGSCRGVIQILEHQSLPLFQANDMRDPFLPTRLTELNFDCQALFERSVKYMTSAILGKAAPRGNPNHPLQKAIRRWRGENRFSDEAEIRDSLVGLLPAMVEKSFNDAKEIHQNWHEFIQNKRLLPFFESSTNADLWQLEAERYSGVVIKFNCADDSLFEQCLPVHYSKQPPKTVSIESCVELMVGELNQIPTDFMELILTQNYQYRTQKEWRLVTDMSSEEEFRLSFPSELIQSIYIGASVPLVKKEQIISLAKHLGDKIHVYQALCSDNSYEFRFEKQNNDTDTGH